MPLPPQRAAATSRPRWFGVRDTVTSTRVAGIFALCGAVYIVTDSLLTNGAGGGGHGLEVGVAVLLGLLGLPPALLPAKVPAPTAALLAAVSVFFVLHLDLATADTGFGAQVYLAWPVLYAAYHLQTRGAWAVAALCVTAHVVLLVGTGGTTALVRDTPAFAATVAILTWTLSSARDRAAAAFDRVHTEATVDVLTGLATRRAFESALRTVVRREGAVAVVLCDVDHFKAVNDGDGHALGDRVLRAVADALHETFGTDGVVARYGGDELVAVVAGPGTASVVERAEEFRRLVEGLRVHRTELAPTGAPEHLRLSVSVGVVVDRRRTGGPRVTPDLLLTAADQALYAAKRGGRNRVVRAGHPDDAVPSRPRRDPAGPRPVPGKRPVPGPVPRQDRVS